MAGTTDRFTQVFTAASEGASKVIEAVLQKLEAPKLSQDELRGLFESMDMVAFKERFGQEEWDRQFHLGIVRDLRDREA